MQYINPEPLVPVTDLLMKTPKGKEIIRLTEIKVRLKLEIEGVYRSNGRHLRAAAKEVGLTARAGSQVVLEKLADKIEQLKKEQSA